MSTPESSQDFHHHQHQTLLSPKQPQIRISDSPPSSASPPPNHRSIPIQPNPIQSLKKPSPLPWSNKETLNLILAYQDKWYSLKRGQLKANQWEEVSVNVAIHCGYDQPSKTATQCRHKIEKLRKRFKAEKQRPNPRAWEFFDFMDRLEKGPLPISARPVQSYSAADQGGNEDDDEIYEAFCNTNRSKQEDDIDHNFRSRKVSRFSESFSDLENRSLNPCNLKRNRFNGFQTESEEEEDDDEEGDYRGGKKKQNKAGWALAGEIRGFAGRFQQMENRKIEMVREIEKCRSDMETKRIDMIRQSQRRIIDTISKALATRKN